jgi:nicotinamidase-related amidase
VSPADRRARGKHVGVRVATDGVRQAADVEPGARVEQAALVIVDMQNDFVRVGAPLEVPDARATVTAQQRLIAEFRRRDRPVIYTQFLARQTENLLWLWSPQCRPDTKCCWKGFRRRYEDAQGELEGSGIIDELQPEKGDLRIEKYGYGAFHGTDLDGHLRTLGVKSLVVTGTVTQICVDETARGGFHHGYRTTLVEDAVSSFAPDLHAATLKNFAMKFGWVADTETLLSWL